MTKDTDAIAVPPVGWVDRGGAILSADDRGMLSRGCAPLSGPGLARLEFSD